MNARAFKLIHLFNKSITLERLG